MNLFCLDCQSTDLLEAKYTRDILKSRGDELIQMAPAHREDVNVTEGHCRTLCVIHSCCYNMIQEPKHKVTYTSLL
jgi:hypothetical protein